MQMEEHRLKEIIKHLESGSINNDNYIIEEGVLYKNRKNGDINIRIDTINYY